MPKANIHRRSTLEEAYPPEAFASDAARNGRVPSGVLTGVRILSTPDATGNFEFERATRQTGEAGSAAFLAPHRREERIEDAGRDSPTRVSAIPDPREGHEAFLADIIAAAQRFDFVAEQSPGRDEPRLRGLRQ